MLIDRRDRRPILLANARILDPSRDMDFVGDLLLADGVVREAKRGIGAAGVPEGTEIVECRGRIAAPGLIDMRAFVGEPGAEHRETDADPDPGQVDGALAVVHGGASSHPSPSAAQSRSPVRPWTRLPHPQGPRPALRLR